MEDGEWQGIRVQDGVRTFFSGVNKREQVELHGI